MSGIIIMALSISKVSQVKITIVRSAPSVIYMKKGKTIICAIPVKDESMCVTINGILSRINERAFVYFVLQLRFPLFLSIFGGEALIIGLPIEPEMLIQVVWNHSGTRACTTSAVISLHDGSKVCQKMAETINQ